MRTFLKTLHLLGFVGFLGSIVTFIVLGQLLPEKQGLALRFNREWVAACTSYLTIPSLWLAGLSGIAMSGIPKVKWLWLKLFGFAAITANTYLLVNPAIKSSLKYMDTGGEPLTSALQHEAIFGGVNLILILLLIIIAIVKPQWGKRNEPPEPRRK